MKRTHQQCRACLGGLALLFALFPIAHHNHAGAQNASAGANNGAAQWPRQITSGGTLLTVYQPQLDAWQGNRLSGRAAVSVQATATATPTYGVAWFTARTDVDKEAALVTLNDIQITRVSLPSGGANYTRLVQQDVGSIVRTLPLGQLEANLAITRAEQRQTRQPLRNDPPRIIYSNRPAVLVLIDGAPALRPVAGTNLLRVINTPALILLDQGSATYYLYLMDRWMQTRSLQGTWTVAASVPPALETARQSAVAANNVDLLDNPDANVKQALDANVIPTVYVSDTPAELVQTQGAPNFAPISGTRLLWAQNSQNSLFLNTANQNYYVLISGRWYRSHTLTSGAWAFVSGTALPTDFAHIPESHPAGDALPSVPGTTQAQQALIAHNIPQTATVRRSDAQLSVTYDGDPQFASIEGTTMQYAVNTATPVVLVAPGSYYACQNGVWFTGSAPVGPWAVTASVPPVIYTIPVTSPINYVTNAYVYGGTPDAVYVGYTPGYLGTYVEPYGCVVYGSGYRYQPWIGRLWIGAPITYGLGVAFDFSIGSGWSIGFGFGYGPAWHPWWGPWWGDWRWRDRARWTDNFRRDHGDWRWHDANLNHFNVYNRWPQNVAVSRPRFPVRTPPATGRFRPGGNTVLAGREGNVYQRAGAGWQARTGNQWRTLPTGGGIARTTPGANLPTTRIGANFPTARTGANLPSTGRYETPAILNSEMNARAYGAARTGGISPYSAGTGLGGYRGYSPTSPFGAARSPIYNAGGAGIPSYRPALPQAGGAFPSLGGSFGGYARRATPTFSAPSFSTGGFRPGGGVAVPRVGGFGGAGGGFRGGRR